MNQLEPNGFRFYCPKSSPAMAFGTSVLVDFKYITHFERIKQIISHFSERIINSFSRFSERIIHGLPRFSERINPSFAAKSSFFLCFSQKFPNFWA
jgi:hypothetical protein